MTELVVGALAAGLAGGLTETGRQAARGAWDRLTSLMSRRRDDVPPGTDEDGGPADAPERGAGPGTYHVVVNGGSGVACGDNVTQNNHFH
ncbi:hypothetical protein [Streptomyces sp. NPDC058953]|uniref:hypothetical protein n=1 Tax=unclassified Streptomyces TaxID=2593676 RepID=UPI00367B696B